MIASCVTALPWSPPSGSRTPASPDGGSRSIAAAGGAKAPSADRSQRTTRAGWSSRRGAHHGGRRLDRGRLPRPGKAGQAERRMSQVLLAIDVGNTHTVIGVYAGDRLIRHWRVLSDPGRTADEYGVLLWNLYRASELRSPAYGHHRLLGGAADDEGHRGPLPGLFPAPSHCGRPGIRPACRSSMTSQGGRRRSQSSRRRRVRTLSEVSIVVDLAPPRPSIACPGGESTSGGSLRPVSASRSDALVTRPPSCRGSSWCGRPRWSQTTVPRHAAGMV